MRSARLRNWLLASSMMAAGLLASEAAFAAACQEANPNEWVCSGNYNAIETLGPATGPFMLSIGPEAGIPYVLDLDSGSPAFTFNAGGNSTSTDPLSPHITLYEGSSITNDSGHGFVLNDPGNVDIFIHDKIEGGAAATTVGPSFEAGDGYRIVGDGSGEDVYMLIGENGSLIGADDGLVGLNIGTKLTVDNHGILRGRGLSTDASNDSEGLHVSTNGNAGSGNRVAGGVEVWNTNTIEGNARLNGNSNPGGQGISISALGDVVIDNYKVGLDDRPVVDDGAQITGTDGIVVYGGGDVTVTNYGHIEGSEGAAIAVFGGDIVNINNHSYLSSIGAIDGDIISGSNVGNLDNRGGLTAGLAGEGIEIEDIIGTGVAAGDASVYIDNTEAGVLSGYWDGADITNVQNGDVVVDNGGYFDKDGNPVRGGVILGRNGDGVDVSDANDSLYINNQRTFEGGLGGVAFTNLDTDYLDSLGVGGGVNTEPQFGNVSDGSWGGIWGGRNGIKAENIGDPGVDGDNSGMVGVYNRTGIVVGGTEDGIHLRNIASLVPENGDAGEYVSVDVFNRGGGMIWGGDDGVDADGTQGNVYINNTGAWEVPLANLNDPNPPSDPQWVSGGTIIGIDKGVRLRNVEGNVWVGNADGLIQGYYGNGIDIRGVSDSDREGHEVGGHVTVDNGYWDDGALTKGGKILAADSAVRIRDADSAEIYNGEGGYIIGDGSYRQAVIDLRNVGGTDAEDQGSYIYNNGIMSSRALPYMIYDWAWNQDAATVPDTQFNVDGNTWDDVGNLWSYVMSAGQVGSVGNLALYSEAASDVLVRTRDGGATRIDNDEIFIGRIRLDGQSVDGEDDPVGNRFVNWDTWITVNNGYFGNSMQSDTEDDRLYNFGLIQTAVNADEAEFTSFDQDVFNNGGAWGDDEERYAGIISMVDGFAGPDAYYEPSFDTTYIHETFNGGEWGGESFLAVDTYLGQWDDPYTGSDRLVFGSYGDVNGTTGIIVHKLNDWPGGINQEGIQVVAYNEGTYIDRPCDFVCVAGDAFYISEYSQDYISIPTGFGPSVGAIRDGMYVWYLEQRDYADLAEVQIEAEPEYAGDFRLVSTFGPNAAQLSKLGRAGVNIWTETDDIVQSQIATLNGGGAGADLAVAYETPTPAAPTNKYGVWVRGSGSWTTEDSQVSQGPFVYDTSFNQDTYSIIAGADMKAGNVDNGFRFGVFGGYITSNLNFDSWGSSVDYTGWTLGAYGAWAAGNGFYIDGTFKADFLDGEYRMPGDTADANTTNLGVRANTGYRFNTGGFFFEPIASFQYVNSSIDNFGAGGAQVNFSEANSVRAGGGLRVGTAFASGGGSSTEVSLLGKVWNEFEDANTVSVCDPMGPCATYTDGISGVFGEVVASAVIRSADNLWAGYLQGGIEFNDAFTTYNAKLGVRRNF